MQTFLLKHRRDGSFCVLNVGGFFQQPDNKKRKPFDFRFIFSTLKTDQRPVPLILLSHRACHSVMCRGVMISGGSFGRVGALQLLQITVLNLCCLFCLNGSMFRSWRIGTRDMIKLYIHLYNILYKCIYNF